MADVQLCDLTPEGTKVVYCPWGCADEMLDEYGYCQHFMGLTNDCKSFEPVGPLIRRSFTDGKDFDTGYMRILGIQKRGDKLPSILPTDRLVNPEEPQTDKGITHMKKKWVSSRVYRESGRHNGYVPARRPEDVPEEKRDEAPSWVKSLNDSIAQLTEKVAGMDNALVSVNERLDLLETTATEPMPTPAEFEKAEGHKGPTADEAKELL